MMAAVTTNVAKKKILLTRAGERTLPAITKMAFGDAGVTVAGNIITPSESQTELNNEIGRYDIMRHEVVSDNDVKYYCKIAEGELNGHDISEMALVDAEGDLVMVKNFAPKAKESDFSFTFVINDTM